MKKKLKRRTWLWSVICCTLSLSFLLYQINHSVISIVILNNEARKDGDDYDDDDYDDDDDDRKNMRLRRTNLH